MLLPPRPPGMSSCIPCKPLFIRKALGARLRVYGSASDLKISLFLRDLTIGLLIMILIQGEQGLINQGIT